MIVGIISPNGSPLCKDCAGGYWNGCFIVHSDHELLLYCSKCNKHISGKEPEKVIVPVVGYTDGRNYGMYCVVCSNNHPSGVQHAMTEQELRDTFSVAERCQDCGRGLLSGKTEQEEAQERVERKRLQRKRLQAVTHRLLYSAVRDGYQVSMQPSLTAFTMDFDGEQFLVTVTRQE